jgi:acyl dehydratase
VSPRLDALSVGDEVLRAETTFERADLVRYAGASGDFNVIHWNARVATQVGLPDVIAHGMLTMARAVEPVVGWCGDPGAVVEYGVRFTKPVVVPDPGRAVVEVVGTVGAVDPERGTVRIDLTATCEGVQVLGKARALVRLPA